MSLATFIVTLLLFPCSVAVAEEKTDQAASPGGSRAAAIVKGKLEGEPLPAGKDALVHPVPPQPPWMRYGVLKPNPPEPRPEPGTAADVARTGGEFARSVGSWFKKYWVLLFAAAIVLAIATQFVREVFLTRRSSP